MYAGMYATVYTCVYICIYIHIQICMNARVELLGNAQPSLVQPGDVVLRRPAQRHRRLEAGDVDLRCSKELLEGSNTL